MTTIQEIKNYVADYFAKLKAGLDRIDPEQGMMVTDVLRHAREEGRRIFIFGNGGSAATASHFANDLNKLASAQRTRKFKAIALTDNVPLITAWGNDEHYSEVFVQQLDNLLEEEDVAIGISCSGNSPNVVKALELATRRRAITIGFLGFDGGRIKGLVDHYVLFEEAHYGRAEDGHLILAHLITHFLRDEDRRENS